MMAPRYRLLADAFFAPDLVYAGSIIETYAPPGSHMEALNEEAREALELFYDEEFEFVITDPQGEKRTIKHRPRQDLRPQPSAPGNAHSVTLLKGPDAAGGNGLTLANLAAQKRNTDQRPGPEPARAPVPAEFLEPVEGPGQDLEPSAIAVVQATEQSGLAGKVKRT